ncbi:UvrD-helicase domain-containing protein [Arenicella sp. 4NH20-0111]|uniref:UvrD-helicase domain-containing protein n=1 Tax=Arenicella sp. 4NH20-0111 TaxID=3127648 RepID=UPI0031038FA6
MIIDLEARRQALNPERSFIVQAPAGSGKTGLLVYRFLTLLTRVEHPQNVLAITFTRKARSEMRERIVELMRAAESGQSSDDLFEQQGFELAQQVLDKDGLHGWQLLDAPHQLQILTIDAFSARLAASMPWLSRLGDSPNTTDSAEVHFAAAVEQVLDELLNEGAELSDDLQIVLHELDFNYDKVRRLFGSMLAKRDQWLRHLVQQDLLQMRSSLEDAWSTLVSENVEILQSLFSQGSLESLFRLACEASQRIDYENPRAALKMKFLCDVDLDLTFEVSSLEHAHWQAIAEFLLVKTGNKVRANPDKNTGFPAGHKDKARCKELFDEYRDDMVLISELFEVSQLPDVSFSDTDWRCMVALERVLKALAIRLQLRFRAAGECDHSEVTQRANLALSELNNPTDLGLLMDGQIHHILVDEFQDTSNSQLELLRKLTMGWQPFEAPLKTLFLVGDPMQSIYRFREADVGLFLQVVRNSSTGVFENLDISPLVLEQNFRSVESLVDWFNHTFEKSFPKTNTVLTGAIRYSKAHSSKNDDGQSPVSYYLAPDREREAQCLLSAVESSLVNLPVDSQIAILVRTRPQLEYLLPLLDQNNIAYTAVDIQPLHEQQSIKDVVALSKAICRDDDRIAWLALLRGPWCGLTLREIHIFASHQGESLWQQLKDQKKHRSLRDDSRKRLLRFVGIMSAALQQHQQVDLGSLTRWTWCLLGGQETLGATKEEDIEQYFELLSRLQRGGDLPTQKELDTGLEKMRATGGMDDKPRVVVSTIHKSKGLQYHTVILPGLANRPKTDDREILMWAEHQGMNGQANLLLAPLLFNAEQGSHYDYLRKLDGKRAANEVMRLMYVACTRAEKKLVLIANAKFNDKLGDVNPPVKTSMLASVWPVLESKFSFEEGVLSEVGQDAVPSKAVGLNQTLKRLSHDYQPALRQDIVWQPLGQLNATDQALSEPEVDYDWATEVATAVGIILHEFLQFAGVNILKVVVDDDLKRRWRSELLALRVADDRIEYALRRLITAVNHIQHDEQARFIFLNHPIEQNEYSLSTLEAGVVKKYRIDRTFVDSQNVRWIVDYKSTMTQNEDVERFADLQVRDRHRKQLMRYGQLMSRVDDRPIKLAVYFPLLKQLRIWDYEPE